MAQSKDLFDDSTMTFGEHLEVLRGHLIKAIIGLVICVIFTLFEGQTIVGIVRSPIDAALRTHGNKSIVVDDLATPDDGPETLPRSAASVAHNSGCDRLRLAATGPHSLSTALHSLGCHTLFGGGRIWRLDLTPLQPASPLPFSIEALRTTARLPSIQRHNLRQAG